MDLAFWTCGVLILDLSALNSCTYLESVQLVVNITSTFELLFLSRFDVSYSWAIDYRNIFVFCIVIDTFKAA